MKDGSSGGGHLSFVRFQSENIEACLDFLKQLIAAKSDNESASINGRSSHGLNHKKRTSWNGQSSIKNNIVVMATGGGAYKYYNYFQHELGVEIIREDEMHCLIVGLDFFITEIPQEVFTFSEQNPMMFVSPPENIYPYLLCNIGSGVSMIYVSGPNKFERVGGSSLGGGTLWGLLSVLTDAKSFDEMLELSQKGDNTKVDMLVGDIYGSDYGKVGLKATTIASTFGKVFRKKSRTSMPNAEDICKSLLFAIRYDLYLSFILLIPC